MRHPAQRICSRALRTAQKKEPGEPGSGNTNRNDADQALAASAFTRAVRRDTLREAVFL